MVKRIICIFLVFFSFVGLVIPISAEAEPEPSYSWWDWIYCDTDGQEFIKFLVNKFGDHDNLMYIRTNMYNSEELELLESYYNKWVLQLTQNGKSINLDKYNMYQNFGQLHSNSNFDVEKLSNGNYKITRISSNDYNIDLPYAYYNIFYDMRKKQITLDIVENTNMATVEIYYMNNSYSMTSGTIYSGTVETPFNSKCYGYPYSQVCVKIRGLQVGQSIILSPIHYKHKLTDMDTEIPQENNYEYTNTFLMTYGNFIYDGKHLHQSIYDFNFVNFNSDSYRDYNVKTYWLLSRTITNGDESKSIQFLTNIIKCIDNGVETELEYDSTLSKISSYPTEPDNPGSTSDSTVDSSIDTSASTESPGTNTTTNYDPSITNLHVSGIFSLFQNVFNIIDNIITGIQNLVSKTVNLITQIPQKIQEFGNSIKSIFSWLPDDIQLVIGASITLLLTISIIKFLH